MPISRIDLPSNRKFGIFFAFIFAVATFYFLSHESPKRAYMFAAGSSLFFIIAVIKADILLPLNELWMRLGLVLGSVVSPIVLGVIFFGIFTPVGMIIRLFGRDELRLKLTYGFSHWITRNESIKSESFRQQF